MSFQFNDGGRAAAGYRGKSRDCAVRAIAIATGCAYREVYAALAAAAGSEPAPARRRNHPRTGMRKSTVQRFLEARGWRFTPTLTPAGRPRVRLQAPQLPTGPLIVALARHLCAVIDGVIHDTYDCSRNGRGLVYGYYTRAAC